MENKNIIDKLKPLQLLYNLEKAGIDINSTTNSSYTKPLDESIENWISRILNENKYLLKTCTKEEFLKNVMYVENKEKY